MELSSWRHSLVGKNILTGLIRTRRILRTIGSVTHHAQHDPADIVSCSIEPSDLRAKHLGFEIYWFISTIHATETDGLWDPTFGSLGTKVANTKHLAHIWSWLLKGHPILCSGQTIRIPLNLHLLYIKLSTFENSRFPMIVGFTEHSI